MRSITTCPRYGIIPRPIFFKVDHQFYFAVITGKVDLFNGCIKFL